MKTKQKPFVIPVFISQEGCPHQCVFCNQHKITGVAPHLPSFGEIESEVNRFLRYTKTPPEFVQLAYFGGNFFGLEKKALNHLLEIAEKLKKNGKIQGIRFSTRPDTITKEHLENITTNLPTTIELGVQSMDDVVLLACRRGHTTEDTRKAAKIIKSFDCEVGLQMMVGLPEDTQAKSLATAREIIFLSPDFVRIYPTVVLSKSILGTWYEKGKFQPLSLASGITLVKQIFRLFNAYNIPVVRMGLQPSEELNKTGTILAGPYHPSFGQMVYSEIILDCLTDFLLSSGLEVSDIGITVHPKNISNVRGLKNQNVSILKKKFPNANISISADGLLPKNMMEVNHFPVKLWEQTTARFH